MAFHTDDSHPQYPELEDAEFGSCMALENFYRERLKRLMPDRVDIIEWVFNQETIEQACETARPS